MSMRENIPKLFVLAFFAVGIVIIVAKFVMPSKDASQVGVVVPELSAFARIGEKAFAATCATCHGVNAAGTNQGPPLVHDIYNPGHHSDEAFLLAAQNGVRQHHWPYGNMPVQPQVRTDQLRAIVRYVRELQAANGIVSRPHTM